MGSTTISTKVIMKGDIQEGPQKISSNTSKTGNWYINYIYSYIGEYTNMCNACLNHETSILSK